MMKETSSKLLWYTKPDKSSLLRPFRPLQGLTKLLTER